MLSVRASLLVASSLLAFHACGGKTIVDGTATGAGSGETTSTTGTSTTTGTYPGTPTGTSDGIPTGDGMPTGTYTGAPDGVPTGAPPGMPTGEPGCQALTSELQGLIGEATWCNACEDSDSCINGPKIHDLCGCPIGASQAASNVAAQAEAVYQQWVSLGCGPYDCDQPCFSPDTPYYCFSNGGGCGGSCQPGWDG